MAKGDETTEGSYTREAQTQNLARKEVLKREALRREAYTMGIYVFGRMHSETLRLSVAVPYFLICWEIGAVLSLE